MARRPRLFAPDLLYHVIARGNQRRPTFLCEADYGAYLRRLTLYRERYDVTLHAYCLMPNHVHLLVRTGAAPLAKFMQGLQQSYTQRFNRVHDKVGHVFQGRYRAIVCETDEYLLTLVRYIHLNPVRAGLVARPEQYPHSSHAVYAAGEPTALLDPALVLRLLGGSTAYSRFVADGLAEGHRSDLYRVVQQQVLGTTAFADGVTRRTGRAPSRPPREPLDAAIGRLATRLGADPAAIRGPDRRRSTTRARALLTFALIRRYGYRPGDVAHALGRDAATVAKIVWRLDTRLPRDDALARDVAGLDDCPEVKV